MQWGPHPDMRSYQDGVKTCEGAFRALLKGGAVELSQPTKVGWWQGEGSTIRGAERGRKVASQSTTDGHGRNEGQSACWGRVQASYKR